MTTAQRQAWFQLGVVALTLVTVGALVPVLGPGAQGGFGLLGLLGLCPWLFRRGHGSGVTYDERDEAIRRRSVIVAYSVFWVAFVGVCVSLPAFYGWSGSVPVSVVQSSVWVGLMLVVGVDALATLVQYGRGGVDAV